MLLALLAAATAQPSPPRETARAVIHILQQVRVTEQQWQSAPKRSERLITGTDGRKHWLRTIDFE